MSAKLRRWMPIALCCLPGVATAAIVGIGVAAGGAAFGASLGGPLGLGIVALALLACPISMSLMMLRQHGTSPNSAAAGSQMMGDCCLPGETPASEVNAAAERLAALQ